MINKDLEKWIEENDPYNWAYQYDRHKELEWCHLWRNGAIAMAEHLNNSEKDVPTGSTLRKIARILNDNYGFIDFPQDIEEEILKHWNE